MDQRQALEQVLARLVWPAQQMDRQRAQVPGLVLEPALPASLAQQKDQRWVLELVPAQALLRLVWPVRQRTGQQRVQASLVSPAQQVSPAPQTDQ
jgi:hypothetical protein